MHCSRFLGKIPNNADGAAFLRVARKMIREKNKKYNWEPYDSSWGHCTERKTTWRLLVKWRIGHNNPHAALYHIGGALAWKWRRNNTIKQEHAQYAGLYLYKYTLYR